MAKVAEGGDERVSPGNDDSQREENGELPLVEQQNGEAADENALTAEQRRQKAEPSRMESFFAVTKSLIIRALIIYFISSFFRKPATTVTDANNNNSNAPGPRAAINVFENGTIFDLYVYLSEEKTFTGFRDKNTLIWQEEGLIYGDWYGGPNGDGSKSFLHKFRPSKELQNNGSIYLHVYATKFGKSPDPESGELLYANNQMSYSRKMVNKYKKMKHQDTHNLLSGEKKEIEPAKKQEILSHWHPNVTVNFVTDQTNWMQGQVPPPFEQYIHFVPGGNFYKPVLYMNEFWNMQRDYFPLNETVEELELFITYQPLSLFKWQLYAAQSMKNQWASSLLGDNAETDDSDQDTLKETLLQTNPYLLGATFLVSILHSVFEFLAFKNDIQFWNNRKSLEGLSVRSVFFDVFQSLIILLFVLDNETNMIVRISCGIGLCIEIWKINKVVDIKLDRERKILGIFPRVTFADKGSYVESSTKKYDRLAFKYLAWALYPLLAGYAVYSVVYLEHRGWYSWVLNMLYGFLLTFGFIMMTPQLFINYKLKSVAHLPWRMMTYKFLNTFIDDIFAFVIKMPTLYRLGCFRDDIVFLVFLYQKWIYKTDHSRVNEFGFTGEMDAATTTTQQKGIDDGQQQTTSKKDD